MAASASTLQYFRVNPHELFNSFQLNPGSHIQTHDGNKKSESKLDLLPVPMHSTPKRVPLQMIPSSTLGKLSLQKISSKQITESDFILKTPSSRQLSQKTKAMSTLNQNVKMRSPLSTKTNSEIRNDGYRSESKNNEQRRQYRNSPPSTFVKDATSVSKVFAGSKFAESPPVTAIPLPPSKWLEDIRREKGHNSDLIIKNNDEKNQTDGSLSLSEGDDENKSDNNETPKGKRINPMKLIQCASFTA